MFELAIEQQLAPLSEDQEPTVLGAYEVLELPICIDVHHRPRGKGPALHVQGP